MSTVFRTTTKVTTIACLAVGSSLMATRCFAETTLQTQGTIQAQAPQTNHYPLLRAQVSPAQLHSIFTPPPQPVQPTSTDVNYRVTPIQERGDRPQLRDLMSRLEPAALPNFVYKN